MAASVYGVEWALGLRSDGREEKDFVRNREQEGWLR